MAMVGNAKDLEAEIAALESQAARLKQVRDILADKAMCDLLRPYFAGQAKANGSSASATKPGVYEKLRQFMLDRNNEWVTFSELAKAGFSKGTARQILYKARPEAFERESNPGGGRETKFRLKESAS